MSNSVALGIIGRADYWSSYPTARFASANTPTARPNSAGIDDDDFLELSIGARLTVRSET
jgi:hypothetical protein